MDHDLPEQESAWKRPCGGFEPSAVEPFIDAEVVADERNVMVV